MDSEKLAQLAREDDAKRPFEMALRYLGYRSRSQKEMITYLEGKGFDGDVIDETIDKLKDRLYRRFRLCPGLGGGRMASKPMGKAMIKGS